MPFLDSVFLHIPLSSINHQFEQFAWMKDRIIVYNKADMADSTKEQMIIDAFKDFRNQTVLFTNANMDKNVRKIIEFAAGMLTAEKERGEGSWLGMCSGEYLMLQ